MLGDKCDVLGEKVKTKLFLCFYLKNSIFKTIILAIWHTCREEEKSGVATFTISSVATCFFLIVFFVLKIEFLS